MPRTWYEVVRPLPGLDEKRAYRCVVTQIEKRRKPPAIVVEIRHLDEPQAGRAHRVDLLLPLRPVGMAADFFHCCSLELAEDTSIAPKDAIGHELLVHFARSAIGERIPARFEPIAKETQHG